MAVNPNLAEYERPQDLPDPLPPDAPPDPNPVPPATADPWATAPTDGNWQAWFLRNVQGLAANPQSLAGLESKLTPHGIKVLKNAAGIAGKIQLPDGRIIDVGKAFSSGDPSQMSWAWQEGDGAETNTPDADWFASNLPAPEPYSTLARPDHLAQPYDAPEFNAPTFDDLNADPGYRARLEASQRGLERSAAAKGSVLSGGFIGRTMPRELQKLASEEYGNLYQRRLGAFTTNAGFGMGARQLNEGAYQNDVTNFLNQYGQRYQTWRDLVGDQFRTAEIGAGTAGASR